MVESVSIGEQDCLSRVLQFQDVCYGVLPLASVQLIRGRQSFTYAKHFSSSNHIFFFSFPYLQ